MSYYGGQRSGQRNQGNLWRLCQKLKQYKDEETDVRPSFCPKSTNNVGPNAASLKLLSAMAVCRRYRDSEEISSLGSPMIDWSRQHHSAPVAPGETWTRPYPRPCRSTNLTNCQEHDRSEKNSDLSKFEALCLCDDFNEPYRCGWCRFECWIKLQGLPKELEIYVLHVLNHLWENTSDFGREEDGFLAVQIIKTCGPEGWGIIKDTLGL